VADNYHRPVLLDEVMDALALNDGGVYVDATVGGGGHSKEIAERIGHPGVVIGIDRDTEALAEARVTLEGTPAKFITVNAPFDDIAAVLSEAGQSLVDGILFDLGVSSHQLDDTTRGFTFRDLTAPLDMRMSQLEEIATAADLLNTLPGDELVQILRENADERWAARIVQFVEERRNKEPFVTAGQLIETVKAAIPVAARSKDIHPATKTFQALRIAVNDEFGRLRRALVASVDCLRPGGRLAVIAYHSGEDRIVKQVLGELSGKCVCRPEVPQCVCFARSPKIELIVKKPILPTSSEVGSNPRARSAKLRIAAKMEGRGVRSLEEQD
jgi:16S rRNA (cytosine1402-N4)-methyltransferase